MPHLGAVHITNRYTGAHGEEEVLEGPAFDALHRGDVELHALEAQRLADHLGEAPLPGGLDQQLAQEVLARAKERL